MGTENSGSIKENRLIFKKSPEKNTNCAKNSKELQHNKKAIEGTKALIKQLKKEKRYKTCNAYSKKLEGETSLKMKRKNLTIKSLKQQVINKLAKDFSLSGQEKVLLNIDLNFINFKSLIGEKGDIQMHYNDGQFEFFNTARPVKSNIKENLIKITGSPYKMGHMVEILQNEVKNLNAKHENLKKSIQNTCTSDKDAIKDQLEKEKDERNSNFNKLVKDKEHLKQDKNGIGYTVDFSRKNSKRVDTNVETKTRIHDLLDLNNVPKNTYIEIKIKNPGKETINAYYHEAGNTTDEGQRTFIDTKTEKRAKVYHNAKITVLKYKIKSTENSTEGLETDAEEDMSKDLDRLGKEGVAILQSIENDKKAEKERVVRRERNIEKRINNLWDIYGEVLDGAAMNVPSTLQDDDDFDKNWKKIPDSFLRVLADEPFNLTASKARTYIQDVIQDSFNSIIYAEDFFKHGVGKKLYPAGYWKMMRNYAKYNKKLNAGERLNDKEQADFEKIDTIITGIVSVLEGINGLELIEAKSEKLIDTYRPILSGAPYASENEKDEEYYSYTLKELLHDNENIPKGLEIQVSPKMEKQITNLTDGGMKQVFMTYGLTGLLKAKCLKKIDANTYILVKLPKTIKEDLKKSFGEANVATLERWKQIRQSIDKNYRSREFIMQIFEPNKGTIKKEVSNWKKLWHWDLSGEEIHMGNLGTMTLKGSDFKKHLSDRRGYLDMVSKTSKMVKGTTVYEPEAKEVVKLTNQYLEYGLIATVMQAPEAQLPNVLDQITRDFDIDIDFVQPLTSAKNIEAILNAVKIDSISDGGSVVRLTDAHIKYVRLGYVLGRQIETSQNYNESIDKALSSNKTIRQLQKQALERGFPISRINEIEESMEQKIHAGIFAFGANGKFGGVGGHISVPLATFGKNGKHKIHAHFALMTADGSVLPTAGISHAIKLGKKVTLTYGVTASPAFVAGGFSVKRPIQSKSWENWDVNAGIGGSVGIDFKNGKSTGIGIGVYAGMSWNKKRAELNKVRESNSIRGVETINAALKNNNIDGAARAILSHPSFGAYTKYLKGKFKLPNETIVEIYEAAKDKWEAAARNNLEIPTIQGFGLGMFGGVSQKGISLGAGAYVTFKIPYTEINFVVRKEHPKYNYRNQEARAQSDLKLALAKKGIKTFVTASVKMSGSSGLLFFDSTSGRHNIAKTDRLSSGLALRESKVEKNLKFKNTFESIKSTFTSIGIHAEARLIDKDNPKKGHFIALTPLRTEGSNLQMLIDPDLQQKGLILDPAKNQVFLSASAAKKLIVTRSTYKFPLKRRGAMNLTVITFKANKNRTDMAIREDSPTYIYKRQGERFTIVAGEMRAGRKDVNAITLEEFNKRQNIDPKFKIKGFETFTNKNFEFSLIEGRAMTQKLYDAINIKPQPKIENHNKIGTFTDKWWGSPENPTKNQTKNREKFKKFISTSTPKTEAKGKTALFKDLRSQFEANNPGVEINEQELNLMYSVLLNKAFVLLYKKKSSHRELNRTLKSRNESFKKYLINHITEFKKQNIEVWLKFKIENPGITPQTIATYLARKTMPRNIKEYLQAMKDPKRRMIIGPGMKYASWTQKRVKINGKRETREYLPTAYGVPNPGKFKDVLKITGFKNLDLKSDSPIEKSSAKLLLRMMSPVHKENLNRIDGQKDFLFSELSLLVMSIYSPKLGVSPMIEILGKKGYKDMIKIYNSFKDGSNLNPHEVIKNSKASFKKFTNIVIGIRKAQLEGEKTYTTADKKFIFHINTKIISGAYMKCANGTIASKQTIGVSYAKPHKEQASWYSSETEKNTSLLSHTGKTFKSMSAGGAYMHTLKNQPSRPKKSGETPGRTDKPTKNPEGSNDRNLEVQSNDAPADDA
jgi:hypothetical protein